MARYLGGLLTTDETQVRPANNFEDTAGNGVFTSDEQLMLNKQSLYPTAGTSNPSKFVENIFSVEKLDIICMSEDIAFLCIRLDVYRVNLVKELREDKRSNTVACAYFKTSTGGFNIF